MNYAPYLRFYLSIDEYIGGLQQDLAFMCKQGPFQDSAILVHSRVKETI